MESDVTLWSTLAKLVVENKTTLFSAILWAAVIGGVVSILNSWLDRKSREQINKETLKLQHQLKTEELINTREIKELELKNTREIKQLEIKSRAFDALFNEFLKSIEIVNNGMYSFNIPQFIATVEKPEDTLLVMSGLSLLKQKADIKNTHYESLLQVIKILKFDIFQFVDYKYKCLKSGKELDLYENLEYKKYAMELYNSTDKYNASIKEYLSYYYH